MSGREALGLLAFVTGYIPTVGFLIGVAPPALLALLTGGWKLAVAVVVIYAVLNFVVQSVIQPKFVSGAVGLSMVVSFLSLVFWSWLIGPLGAVLAVPLTLLAKAMLVDPTGKGFVIQRGQFVGRPDVVQGAGQAGGTYEINWRVDRIRPGDVVLVREDPSNPDVPSATRVRSLRSAG